MKLSRYSLEYVFVPVTGPTTVTLSGLTHQIAIVPRNQTVSSGDWKTAPWDTNEQKPRLLVRASPSAPTGSPDVTLALGVHDVWWRVTSNPETPARFSGILEVI